jgi:hypothetical protein
MSEFAPGTFQFAERSMKQSVREAHQWAEARRLQRQAMTRRIRVHRFYFDAMSSLGCRLASWGERLQERYSSEGSAQATQSA